MRRIIASGMLLGMGYALWRENQRERNTTSLQNKVVIVTGAAAGIGRSTAHAFAREQAHLILVDSDAQGLAAVQSEVAQYGHQPYTVSIDLTEDDVPREIITYALEQFGRVDVLVNNAGLILSGDVTLHEPDAVRRLFDVNVLALMRLTQAAVVQMKHQHSGYIVNVASFSATMPSPGFSIYGASKGAVRTFSAALRRELKLDGIHVACVSPGFVNTQMVQHMGTEKMKRAGMIDPSLGLQLGEPHQVAAAIVRAVTYHDGDVVVGSAGYHVLSWLERLSPALIDWLFTLIVDRDKVLDTSHRPR